MLVIAGSRSRRFVARWIGWSLLCFAIIALSFRLVEFLELITLTSQNADWFDAMVRDPNKNWVGLLLGGLGSGWLLARVIH
jgi:hypothetical protein